MNKINREIVDLEGYVFVETEYAYLISVDDDIEEENAKWVPKSQIEFFEEGELNMCKFSIPEWVATEKGFI